MSVSAHKIGGPKGVGFLYIRKGLRLRSFLHGGSQERGRRAGTENVPGIVGFGEAIRLALASMEENAIRERHLRDRLVNGILEGIPYTRCSSTAENCLPGLANICFCHTDADSLLILLDMAGICVSAGSACTSGSLDPSHVLLAAGLSHEDAKSSVRFTIGPENTEEESLSIAKVLTIPYLIPSKSVRGESGYAGNVAGIPSLLLERGYANYCKEEWISEYQKDIFLCLHALGIYSYEEMEHKEKVILRKMIYQTAEEDGLWFPEITEGARVRKGDLLGRTEDFYGNLLQEYKAVEDGIVMYYTCGLRAAKGHSLVAYGLSESMEVV